MEQLTVKQLNATRDLLLPGLRGFAQKNPDLVLDMKVDYGARGLDVEGFNQSLGMALGFLITEAAIQEELYVKEFKPTLERMVKLLKQPLPGEEVEALREAELTAAFQLIVRMMP